MSESAPLSASASASAGPRSLHALPSVGTAGCHFRSAHVSARALRAGLRSASSSGLGVTEDCPPVTVTVASEVTVIMINLNAGEIRFELSGADLPTGKVLRVAAPKRVTR